MKRVSCLCAAARLLASLFLILPFREDPVTEERGNKVVGLLLLLMALPAHAQFPAQNSGPPAAPVLRIETGMHTAPINGIATDAHNRFLVTASADKTLRLWDAATGQPLSVIRPPLGGGDEGKLYAVALSPDAATIACGGITGYEWDKSFCLYLFDRATGRLTQRIAGLPDVIPHLAYSPDGRFLAAALYSGGVRLYRTGDYAQAGQDADYADQSCGCAFSPDGTPARLATTCLDGYVRLYSLADDGSLHLTAKSKAPGGGQPFGVAFSPDGTKLAAGFADAPRVAVLSAADLSPRFAPDTAGMTGGSLSAVCWSADGRQLYAGGRYWDGNSLPVRRWDGGGKGAGTDLKAAGSTIFDLAPRKAGGVFFGAGEPSFGALDADGKQAFFRGPDTADLRDNQDGFQVSQDGGTVRFAFQVFGKTPASFSLAARALAVPPTDAGLLPPVTAADGLDVQGWNGTTAPTLNGKPLPLKQYEQADSLAIAPDRQSFLLGTDWYVRCFGRDGTQKWKIPTPGVAWAVNVSGDGRLALAAFGDGTIRWFRMTDGQELAVFFPDADQKRWVLWTPSGYYDCSPGGEDLIGWHVNRGADQAADFFPASRFRDTFYRPDVVAKVLTTLDEGEALKEANAATGRKPQDQTQTAAQDIQQRLPPVVTLLSPEEGANVSDAALTVRYTIRTPSGEPVTQVRALVDGRPVQTESDLSVVSPDGVTRTVQITLPARDCLVSVLAFNRFAASEPASAHVHWQAAAKGVTLDAPTATEFVIQPKLYVLAVGISQYQDADLRLTYPSTDAADFVAAMQAQKGKLYRDVQVYGGKALTDADATKDAIEDGLEWIQKQTTSNDVAMIFLSGHGNNDANGKYFFLPAGFSRDRVKSTGLPWTDIVSTVQDIAGKVILFNDSCHSGNVLGGTLKGLPPDNTGIINELVSAENGAVVFAAATGSEYALERPDWGNGAFTKALVEGIDGKADYGHTGRITVNMLSLYISERVKALTGGEQHPTEDKPPTVRDFPLAADP